MMRFLYILLFVFALSSCKTKYVPVESIKTEYRDRYERDSIYLKEYINTYQKGDTIFKDVFIDRYRNRYIHDTINKTDSIAVPYPYPVPGPKENILSSFQSFQIWCGRILLFLVLGYGAFRFIRKKFN